MQKIVIMLLITVFLTGCAAASETTPTVETPAVDPLTSVERARVTLTAYLDALSQGMYERAGENYGGDMEVLSGYNPTLDPSDVPGLLKNACEFNGFMCLPPLNILKEETLSDDHFEFTVQLVDKEGQIFEIGACCGEDPENVVPVNEFVFIVERQNDEFKVLTLPPYVP